MSRSRLEKLEAVVTVTPEDPGSYCRDCGGLRIDEVMLAIDTLDRADTHSAHMTADAAKAVCEALAAGKDTCRRRGAQTLSGCLREDLRAEDGATSAWPRHDSNARPLAPEGRRPSDER